MRALAGVSWGQSRETLLLTFKALIKPLISYAAPVWFPNVSPSTIRPLQAVQNAALRIASGAVLMTSQHHLHNEAEVLPVKEELSMLCSQFLLSTLRPGHPSHEVITADTGPREIRSTLLTKHRQTVQPYLEDGVTPEDSYRQSLADIHRRAVADAIASYDPNRVLDQPPPPVSAEEKSLPRHTRTTLAQLRTGFSSALEEYLHRIGRAPSKLCPECGAADHTVPHLFS